MTSQTITYTYDPLYRLTAADYTDGRFFHYVYDPVGNRMSQDSKTDPITNPVTKTYTYDSANRLTGVNGASYTWDNDGNLLSDGTSSYEYDPMNHLTQLVNGNDAYKFNYDSQGNRVGQAVNGAWTYYDLDLNAGLTQVLTAQDEDYLYGLGLVAQNDPGDIEYLFIDGLGSVRQIVRGDSFGQVTLTRSYDPFGSVLTSVGNGASAFGYAGQWQDGSGLIDMRARYYSSADGRFLTKDTWQGDQIQPMSYDPWSYTYENPIINTDPNGMCPLGEADRGCDETDQFEARYGITFIGNWDCHFEEKEAVRIAATKIGSRLSQYTKMSGEGSFHAVSRVRWQRTKTINSL
jgi:RHS repeat-associated protein